MGGQTGGTVMPVVADERGEEHPTTEIQPVHRQEVRGSGVYQHTLCLMILNVVGG